MHSATANTPIVAARSVIVTRAARIRHQDRIRVGLAYLTRKAANCDLILPNALSSAERASACSLASVFAAVAALEKDSFSSGEWRTNSFACALFNQVCTRSASSAECSTRKGAQNPNRSSGDQEPIQSSPETRLPVNTSTRHLYGTEQRELRSDAEVMCHVAWHFPSDSAFYSYLRKCRVSKVIMAYNRKQAFHQAWNFLDYHEEVSRILSVLLF